MKNDIAVQRFVDASQSESTKRSYAQDIRHFRQWGGKIPTTPQKLAEYLAEHAASLAVATLQHRLVAIHKAHVDLNKESPARDPLVRKTMQGIRRTKGVNQRQRQVKALVKDDLVELLVAIVKQRPIKAARDKAMMLVGFAGAFRRSELVALTVEDITPHAHGIELLIRRSKTDQEGQGRTVFIPRALARERCPVEALRAWMEVGGIERGALFRSINRHDRVVSERPLTPQAVALIVKTVVKKARGTEAAKHVAGHSLRAGFITEAATAGLQTHVIMGQSGHTSVDMVLRYIRPVHRRALPSLL